MIGIIVGLVIALVILVVIIIVVILVRRRKSSKKPPKGAKPLPTKDEISHGGINGQNGKRGHPV
jgi:heme/copper-type cytochrome/quinol oxidase subunit 2